MANNYGVVTFDNAGPIKTWSKLAAVAAHNNREKPEPHCDPEAPRPIHLCGTSDLVGDTKARMLEHGINPTSLRSNGNIAFEAVMTASSSFFNTGTYEDIWRRIGRWVGIACNFARSFWGEHRIVSMVLHLDETTPHIHAVILPLDQKDYTRWSDRKGAWALDSRVICGPGVYQRMHDAYAAAMAPLGLVRGVSGSRAKHRPYVAELVSLDMERAKASDAAADAEQAAAEARSEADQLAAKGQEQDEVRARFNAEVLAHEAKVKAEQAALAKRKAELRAEGLKLEARKREFVSVASGFARERQDVEAARREVAARAASLHRTLRIVNETVQHAVKVRQAVSMMSPVRLSSEAAAAVAAINDLDYVSGLVEVPANDLDLLPPGVQQHLKKLDGGRR